MAKRKMNEKSLENLKKGEATRFHGESAVKAAEKSNEVQKKYRPLKELAKEALDEDTWKEILTAMIARAKDGNPRAFELLRDSAGEKPVDRVELDGGILFTFDGKGEDFSQ